MGIYKRKQENTLSIKKAIKKKRKKNDNGNENDKKKENTLSTKKATKKKKKTLFDRFLSQEVSQSIMDWCAHLQL